MGEILNIYFSAMTMNTAPVLCLGHIFGQSVPVLLLFCSIKANISLPNFVLVWLSFCVGLALFCVSLALILCHQDKFGYYFSCYVHYHFFLRVDSMVFIIFCHGDRFGYGLVSAMTTNSATFLCHIYINLAIFSLSRPL